MIGTLLGVLSLIALVIIVRRASGNSQDMATERALYVLVAAAILVVCIFMALASLVGMVRKVRNKPPAPGISEPSAH